MARKKETQIPNITERGSIATILETGSSLNGILEFKKPLQIDGHFEGEIITDSVLLISPRAVVRANIKAGTVIIGGQVIGNVEAFNRLEMLSTGQVIGNIRTAKLQIADGVIFDGNCEMIYPDESKEKNTS